MTRRPLAGDGERAARRALGTLFLVVAVVLALAATWAWALTGMSTDVGIAWFSTCVALALGGAIIIGTA